MDAVTANTALTVANVADTVPDRYFRADQIVVAGNAAATEDNWRRVRSLRIGLVMRGPAGSSQEVVTPAKYPLGFAFANATGDKGTVLAAQTDGRLRQANILTIYLHNNQGS